MIECRIAKTYGKKQVLNLTRDFDEGKIYAVIGNNGSGKSTFLNALSRQIPFDGEINGVKNVIYMTQNAYNFDLSVKNNVLLFVSKKDVEKRRKAEKMMAEIGLCDLSKKNARKLSGGEWQKTALVRTLLQKCDVLLLDEPTSSMDVSSSEIAERMIKEYQKENNCTVFIVTHSVSLAERIADEIIFLDGGEIIESGADIIANPSSPQLQTFLKNR